MTHGATMNRYFLHLCRPKLLSSRWFQSRSLKSAIVSDCRDTFNSLLSSYSRCVSSYAVTVRQRCCPVDVNRRWYSDTFREELNGQNVGVEDELEEVKSDHTPQNQNSTETFSLDVLVSLLRQENAVDICVIKVPEQIKYAQYFIVVSGVSPRHLSAMSQYAIKVYKYLKKDHETHIKIEGKNSDDWMCIDFGSMVVHFMLPETRDVYELEKLWTLRLYDEQLQRIPAEKIPEDFIYDLDDLQK